MSKAAPTGIDKLMQQYGPKKKSLSAPAVYCIVTDHLVWRGKSHRQGDTPELAPRDQAEQSKLDLHLGKGWIRVATAEDRQKAADKPATPATIAQPAGAATVPAVGTAAPVQVQMVPLDKIRPDPTQPRKDFNEASMKELVDSVKQIGIEQAILVRPMSRWRQIVSFAARQWVRRKAGEQDVGMSLTDFWASGIKISLTELEEGTAMNRLLAEGRVERDPAHAGSFLPVAGALAPSGGDTTLPGENEWLEIVYGERRFRGAGMAGLKEIPAKVRELSDKEAAELQAIENLDRDDLNAMEEATQYDKLRRQGCTMERIVEVTGRARNTIFGKLKLLTLPTPVQEAVKTKTLSAITAERIARKEGRVQELVIEAIFNAADDDRDGEKLPSDRKCQEIIAAVEKEEDARLALEAKKAEYAKRGIKWLEGSERERLMGNYQPKDGSGLIVLNQECQEDSQYRSYNQLLAKKPGKAAAKVIRPTMATTNYNGEVVELYVKADVIQALKDAGVEFTKRSEPSGKSEDAKRRAKDKMMKGVIADAAKAISLRSENYFCPRIAQTPEAERMWRALARSAAHLVRNDDLRAFIKRHDIPPVMSTDAYMRPTPDFQKTMEQHLASRKFGELAAITAELLLTAGAWWSQSSDFGRAFSSGAGDFGIDLQQIKQEHGWTDQDEKEARAAAKRYGPEDDDDEAEEDSAGARTTLETVEAEAA